MQKDLIIFDSVTGQIKRTITCDNEIADMQVQEGESVIYGKLTGSDMYVLNGTLAKRPENPTQLNNGVLTNVPLNSILYINGKRYDLTDTTVELSFTYDLSYLLEIFSPFPYLKTRFNI